MVALHGSYVTDNYGDVLLMAIYKRWIEAAHPEVAVALPFASDSTLHHLSVRRNGLSDLLVARLLVYGGGGYFGEPPTNQINWGRRMLVRHLAPGLLYASLGRPIIMNGVGAGPISNPLTRRLAGVLARRCLQVGVRDEESAEFMASLGVSSDRILVGADAAVSLDLSKVPASAVEVAQKWLDDHPADRRVAVHLTWPSSRDRAIAQVVAGVLEFASRQSDVRIIAITDQARADGQVAAANELAERLPGRCDVFEYRDPWTLTALLASLDAVLTVKLHVGIVAATLGTPVLSFRSHPKTARFYRQIGLSEFSVPLAEARTELVVAALERAVTAPKRGSLIPVAVRAAAEASREALQNVVRQAIS